MNQNVFAFIGRRAATLAALSFLAPVGLFAQTFETVYGPPTTVEQGARRVKPVEFCPDEGFIAVGTTASAASPYDAYLVRTRPDGSTVWELSYDIGPGGNDRGNALAEARDGSGFILVGTTRASATAPDHVFLVKVGCDGSVVWAQTYLSGGTEAGLDVVEAQSGDRAFGTRRGDLLVAGFASNAAGNRDGLLFRARGVDGSLIWNHRYDYNGATEVFRGLTEGRGTSGSPTGDVVAAGVFFAPGVPTARGYVVRADGNTGLIGPAPQNAVIYGTADPQSFESVVELRNLAGVAPFLVMAGATSSPGQASDVLLTRTGIDPFALVTSRRIGDVATAPLGEEAALDLHEVTNPLSLASPGQLALTGRAGRPGTAAADAFLLIADPGSLKPAAPGRLFGDHADRRDWGVSVSDHRRGFVIAGFSDSDFEGVGDRRDLYLIGTDDGGKTDCVKEWEPPSEEQDPSVRRVFPQTVRFLDPVRRDVKVERLDSPFPACR